MKTTTQKVLVAVDGSSQALDAVRYVAGFFPPMHTDIVLFHVAPEVPEAFLDLAGIPDDEAEMLPVDAWARRAKEDMGEFMERGREVLIRSGFPKKRAHGKIRARRIGIARDILQEAEQGYAAVVVGRSGMSDLKDVVVGSVAHKLVSRLHAVPIAVVGGDPEPQKVLICFDGSEGSMKGVDFVCSMLPGKEHVITLCLLVRSLGIHGGPELIFSVDHETAWLRSVSSRLEPAFPEAESRIIDAGFHPDHVFIRILENVRSRAESIRSVADTGGFGTIVVGRRGRSVVSEFTMGRVCRKVLHMANRQAVWVV